MMANLDEKATFERLLQAYEDGLLNDAELYDALLVRAEGEDPGAYLERIPIHHRRGFALAIENYPMDGTGVYYSGGFDPPPEHVVRQLQATLVVKRAKGWVDKCK
ncbi:hypothetical protein ACMHYB_20870 [Sorangium sp. So ce1128]